MCKSFVLLSVFAVVLALLGNNAEAAESVMPMPAVEESTVSPIADMALIDAELKTSTEKPPLAVTDTVTPPPPATSEKAEKSPQPHTVADFIIHPLIAFKPRQPEDADALAKQAASGSTPASTTASPWQLFGFNTGQGLGSSVQSLAGSVTGWLNDRIQLPGLVDTPVRESTTTSSTTTTTQRPDIVVRVQSKGSTRRPVIQINGNNRPNRFNNNQLDSDETDDEYDDEDDFPANNNFDDEFEEDEEDDEDNDNDDSNEEDDDEDEQIVQRPNNRRRPVQQQPNRRRVQQFQQQPIRNQNRRRQQNGNGQRQQQVVTPNRRRPIQQVIESEEEEEEEEADDSGELQADSEEFFYGPQTATSSKRSQNQPNFIQRGQQNLINQIRQFTRGQTPGEIGSKIRKSQQSQIATVSTSSTSGNKQQWTPQRATLLVNRNGQTIYIAPELLDSNSAPGAIPTYQYIQQPQQTIIKKQVPASSFPQPPLTVPLKRKGYPTQYITIPWSQLGISPPDQHVVSVADGIQSQPVILNIPQSAINTMQEPNRKKKRPAITASTVPLLADVALMDIFKPPKIPPSRTTSITATSSGSPVLIATNPKPSGSKGIAALLPTRIRAGTIVEKAPATDALEPMKSEMQSTVVQVNGEQRHADGDYILVGDDNEPGVTRHVQPVFGESRYVYNPYTDILHRGFAVRKSGRSLENGENVEIIDAKTAATDEHFIPVEVVQDDAPVVDSEPQTKLLEQIPELTSQKDEEKPVQEEPEADFVPSTVLKAVSETIPEIDLPVQSLPVVVPEQAPLVAPAAPASIEASQVIGA